MLSSKSFLLSGESKGGEGGEGGGDFQMPSSIFQDEDEDDEHDDDGDFVAASGVCVESTSKYDGALHSDCDIIGTDNQHGKEPANKFPTELLSSKVAAQTHPAFVAGA